MNCFKAHFATDELISSLFCVCLLIGLCSEFITFWSHHLLWKHQSYAFPVFVRVSTGGRSNYVIWCHSLCGLHLIRSNHCMGFLLDTQNCGLCMRRECRECFPHHRLQMRPLVSDPGMHHDMCVTHVPWCMSGSLIRGGGETFPAYPAHAQPAIFRIW